MCFISTFIDLSQGMLFVESPRCKERLQIRLESDVYDGVVEDIELFGQRYMMLFMLSIHYLKQTLASISFHVLLDNVVYFF